MLRKFLALPAAIKFELILYPFLLLYRMPVAWIRSLWAARVLLNGQWSRYMGFHPHNSINSFFYRTQWVNLDRYGRSQRSPVLGLGDFPLINWFHLSLPASYIYANAGAVTTLACTVVWVLSNLVWIGSTPLWWALLLSLILFFSSTAYAMAFARQNYQMLGWMFLPAALYLTSHANFAAASIMWFAAGLSGLTPAFFSVPIVLSIAIVHGNIWLTLVLIPILTYAATRFIPLITCENRFNQFTQISKLIGLTNKKVRYDRQIKNFGVVARYFLGLYSISVLLFSLAQHQISVLPLIGLLLFLTNQRFIRVADEQSLIVIIVSLLTFTAMQSGPSVLILFAYWVAVNPMGWFLSIQHLNKHNLDGSILVYPPFDHTKLIAGVEDFLLEVQPGQRVYFAFEDPKGLYHNIFDGYRVIHELPLLVSSNKAVHLFPDWWAVAQTNFEGAPQCWGRSVQDVIGNCQYWSAHYAIVYQSTGDQLDQKWNDDFSLVAEFDWGNFINLFNGVELWPVDRPVPKWFLLRPKSRTSTWS